LAADLALDVSRKPVPPVVRGSAVTATPQRMGAAICSAATK
jgi:hypothetical protein